MDISEFAKQFSNQMKEVNDFLQGDDVKDIMGVEAVNHFKDSFKNEGFTDETLEKWQDVERRNPSSKWYKEGKASAGRKILSGETKELQQSTSYTYISDGVRITNATPYASVHQNGGMAKIFGKKEFTMKARPFIGKSVVMIDNIKDKITNEIKDRLTK